MSTKHSEKKTHEDDESRLDSGHDYCWNQLDRESEFEEDSNLDNLYSVLEQDTSIEHYFYQGSDSLMIRQESDGNYIIIANETGEFEDPGIPVKLTGDQLFDFCEYGAEQKTFDSERSTYLTDIGPFIAIIDVETNKCFTFTNDARDFLYANM